MLVSIEPYVKGMTVERLIEILESIREKHGPQAWIANSQVQDLTVWLGVQSDHARRERGIAGFDDDATMIGVISLSDESYDEFGTEDAE